MQVLLIDPRQAKRVPGRPKTDRLDCKWLQRLHAYGLLAGAFRPEDQVCVLRSYLRHRQMLLSILDLEQITVNDIMVPRQDIASINVDDNWEDIPTAIDALDHTLGLSRPGAARLLVIVSDGMFRADPRSAGQQRIDREHVLAGVAVAQRARAAGIVAHHAADGGARGGGDVDRKPQPVRAQPAKAGAVPSEAEERSR